MPDQPKDEGTVETESGSIGKAKTAKPTHAAAAANTVVPKELLDERQRQLGERRKPAGPPQTEAASASLAVEQPSNVPPTDCDDSQSK